MTPLLGKKDELDEETEEKPTYEDLEFKIKSMETTLNRRLNEIEALQTQLRNLREGIQPVGIVEEVSGDRAIFRTGSDNRIRVYILDDLREQVKPGVRAILNPMRSAIVDVLGDTKERQLMEYKIEKLPDVTFEDVVGLKDELQSFRRAVEWIVNPEVALNRSRLVKDTRLMDDMGSVLLFGPPGVGKTFMAKALAGSISKFRGVPTSFIKVESYELVTKWLGESADNVKKLFKMARDYAPTILFMDEVDAISRHRTETSTDAGRDVQGMLNQLLAEMGEGFKSSYKVATVLATNYPQSIDAALMSRVKRVIYVPPPRTDADIYMILDHYLEKVELDPALRRKSDDKGLRDSVFDKLYAIIKSRTLKYEASIRDKGIMVTDTYNTTPRELKNIVQEAVSEASYEGKPYVTYEMLETQLKKLVKLQPSGINYQ